VVHALYVLQEMKNPEWPLFVFLDDTSIEICESLEDARRDYEGIDVESGVFSFFDFSGYPLKPVFTIPNRHSKFLGLIRSCSSGVFEFERESSLLHDIDLSLSKSEHLAKTERFGTLDDVCDHLANRGHSMKLFRAKRQIKQEAEQAAHGDAEPAP